MRAKHEALFNRVHARFAPAVTQKWEEMVLAWDDDMTKPNPYAEPHIGERTTSGAVAHVNVICPGSTQAQVNKELAQEETEDARRGDIQVHEVSPNTFLRVGFELEEQQYVFSCDICLVNLMYSSRRILSILAKKKKHSKDEQLLLLDKRNVLRRRIERWQDVQAIYMPAVSELRARDSAKSKAPDHFSQPEATELYLPSFIPASSRTTLSGGLVDKEKRMRVAQADDALAELRKLLRVTMGLWSYKHTQIGPSQRANTRARSMIGRFRDKINRAADRYRVAYAALKELDPGGDWMLRLLQLKADDVRAPCRHDEEESEGKRELSWIWVVQGDKINESDTEVGEEEIDESKSNIFVALSCFSNLFF
jgi:hypothetical protein